MPHPSRSAHRKAVRERKRKQERKLGRPAKLLSRYKKESEARLAAMCGMSPGRRKLIMKALGQ